MSEGGPESAAAGRGIIVNAVDEAVVHHAGHLLGIRRQHAAGVEAALLDHTAEASIRHLASHSLSQDQADVSIEHLALGNQRLARRKGELAATADDALTEHAEHLRELAVERVDVAATGTDGVEVSHIRHVVLGGLAASDAVNGSTNRLAHGRLSVASGRVALRNVIDSARLSLMNSSIRGGRRGLLLGGSEARTAAGAVAAGASHEGAALTDSLAGTESLHGLTAAETRLPLKGAVDTTKSKNTRDFLCGVVLGRESDSLVQAASLASGLATRRRHNLLQVDGKQLATLTLNITSSASNTTSTSTAAGDIRVDGTPVADITIETKSISAAEATKATKTNNQRRRINRLRAVRPHRCFRIGSSHSPVDSSGGQD